MQNLISFLLLIYIILFSLPATAKSTDEKNVHKAFSAVENPTDQLYFALSSNEDGSFDRFYLNFHDTYSEGYRGEEDAIKMSTSYSNSPAFWSLLDGMNQPLVVYGLPMVNNRKVNVGYSVAKAGEYTFRMNIMAQKDLQSIILIDNVTGSEVDLQTSSYSFSTSLVTNENSRFELLINYTDPENLAAVIAGNVHISGPIRSQGAIHVYAATGVDTGKIEIDNSEATALLATDTVIFYSNDTSDGLLMNLNTKGGGVQGLANANPKKTIVRKTFASKVHTYFSLPFPVTAANIKIGSTNQQLTDGGTDWGVWGFDAEKRSEHENFKADVWKEITYTSGLAKAAGYQFYHVAGGDVDFVTTSSGEITKLFDASASKDINYTMYKNKSGPQGEKDAGWAFIGGLNSTAYQLNGNNIGGYPGTIWYRQTTNSQSSNTQKHTEYRDFVPSDRETVNLAPYTPFYIQGEIFRVGDSIGIFTYKPEGLSLASATFRSAGEETSPIKDQLYFALSSDKDDSYDRFYLNFTDGYTESYRAVEDAIKMSTFYSNSPTVWSLQDEMNQELVVNGLPMKDERSVNIGFSVPESGDYTISLTPLHQTNVRNVVLVDNVTGQKVDLLQTPYSFNTGTVEEENNRFTVFINSSYTSTPTINSRGVYAYIKDNLLTIKHLSDGNRVQVLDLAGRTIVLGRASGQEFSTTLNAKGTYIVTVTGEKTTVLKVLNK
jgi:hypothetical protein